jgi:hypothetical protein
MSDTSGKDQEEDQKPKTPKTKEQSPTEDGSPTPSLKNYVLVLAGKTPALQSFRERLEDNHQLPVVFADDVDSLFEILTGDDGTDSPTMWLPASVSVNDGEDVNAVFPTEAMASDRADVESTTIYLMLRASCVVLVSVTPEAASLLWLAKLARVPVVSFTPAPSMSHLIALSIGSLDPVVAADVVAALSVSYPDTWQKKHSNPSA